MKQEYRDLSKRKRLILAYLEKHPLSTVREISDKYASKRGNYDGVKSAISELKEEGKIESLIHRAVYFLKPPKNQEKRMLISIMKSPKVFQPSFKNLPFDDDFRVSKSLFPQVVEQCIHLFHMQFKIFLLETRLLGSDNLTYRQQKRLRRYFVTDFVGLLESYSYKNVYAQGWFIREREKDDPATKNPDQETILVWLSNYILVKYEQDQLYFKMMNRFKQIPFNERVQLLEMSVDDSPKDVALARDTTLKNVHRLLGPLMYEGGTTRTDILGPWKRHGLRGFSIEKAEIFRQALDGRRFWMNIENTDLSRILFKIIAKQHLLKLTTKRERQRMAIRWKKNLGVDVSKMTGLFDI